MPASDFSAEGWAIYTDAVHSLERARQQHGAVRDALALIVGAFTNGVYCGSCGEPVDDCGCVINNGREALR